MTKTARTTSTRCSFRRTPTCSFPCFDQPDLKARLTLELTVPQRWNALANGITENVDTRGRHGDLHISARPIRFRRICSRSRPARGRVSPAVRGDTNLWVRASRASRSRSRFAAGSGRVGADVAREILRRSVSVQQFQYMLSPAFPFGGMEHPGATMFNEESFIYREPPTLNQRLGRRATIYHEVAHHWFGDYVTMKWFDDLWLKEGFATYMAAKMQAIEAMRAGERSGATNPWMSFYLRNKPAAYDVDQTSGHHAGVASAREPRPSEEQLRRDRLQQSAGNSQAAQLSRRRRRVPRGPAPVSSSRIAYGNATWQDLLASIGTAANRPLTRLGKAVHPSPGHAGARAAARRRERQDSQTDADSASGAGAVRQRRLADAHRARALVARRASRDRFRSRFAPRRRSCQPQRERRRRISCSQTRMTTPTGSSCSTIASAAWLGAHIGEVNDPFLRAMLWGAMWDLVRDARLAPTQFIATAMRELPERARRTDRRRHRRAD